MRKIYLYLTLALFSFQYIAQAKNPECNVLNFEESNLKSNSNGCFFNHANLIGITGNLFFCAGSSTVLDAGVNDTYLWSTGATTQTITVNVAGTYSVTVEAGNIQSTYSATVVEFQNPVPILIGNLSFCTGSSTNLTTGNFASVLWSTGATSQTISVSTPGDYTVSVTDLNGCTGSASVTVVENQNPVPIISGDLEYCVGFSTTLDAGNGYSSYLWNDGSSIQMITITNPGSYTASVSDANGCTGSNTVLVIENQATPTNISANGPLTFCDGDSVRLSADIGYSSYLWSNGAISRITKIFTNGIFTVTVTDGNGCSSTSSISITVNPIPIILNVDSTEVDCNGNFTGSFDVIATAGTGPYGYTIDGINYQATGLFTGLAFGSYTITVVDSGTGCIATQMRNVGQPDAITAFNITLDNICYGEAQGLIDLNVSGGVEPYSYLWSNGSTDEDLTGLVTNIYTVAITDANNCSYVNVYEILEPSQITVGTQQTNISCSYGSDGTAYVDVNGGTPGYNYLWSDGQTDAFAFGLGVGNHSVSITDANGCDTIMNFTITQPSQLNTTSIESNVTCYDANDGSVTVFPYGGTPYTVGAAYEITWNTIPVQTGATATGLAAGLYSAMILDSAGCIKYHIVTITQPSLLSIGISKDDASCFGNNDGEATLAVNGGTPSYTYLWSNGQTTITASGLLAGSYTVTVNDFAACSASAIVVIAQPTAINVSGVVINVKCNGESNGKVTLSVSGGAGVYSYLWNTNPARTTKNLNNVISGTYSVVVTDNSGCSVIQTFVISQPDVLACNGIVTNTNCNGGATGSVILSPAGGTPPYSILWSNGNTTVSNQSLLAGIYTVTLTDAKNCVATCTYTITNSASVIMNSTIQNVTCFGSASGAIIISLSDGSSPFTYLWNNGATTLSVSGLNAGTYTLIVTDNSGCTTTSSYTVTEPAELSCICNANVTNVSCYEGTDGSINAQPIGGTAPYSYLWSNGLLTQTISGLAAGTYTVTITDANGCQKIGLVQVTQPSELFAIISCTNNATCFGNNNGSACVNGSGGTLPYSYSWNTIPVQTTFAATGLASGTYTATVADINGCTATATLVINQPSSSISCSTSKTNVVCFGQSNGQATAFSTGGTAPYTYQWNTIPSKTTKTVLGLKAGSYTVIITDASGCTCSSVVNIGQPPQLLALASASNVSCNGGSDGSIDITVTGGSPSYTYNWSNGSTTQDVSNLDAGTYQVTITDSKGCIAIVNVVLIQPIQLTCSTGSTNVSCNNGSNGSVFVIGSGGSAPYSYLWSTGGINAIESGLGAGTYTATVTDSKGCTTSCTATITQPPVISCLVTVLDNVTCGANNGKLQVTASGGTPAYSYLWSTIPMQTSAIASGLAPGSYAVLVTDINGCTTICSSNLGSILTVTCNITGTNVSCNGGTNGTATLNPSGGTPPYSYLWNTVSSATTAGVSDLTAGTYVATVTDDDGCTSNCSIIITEPSVISVSISSTNVTCVGGNSNDGTATENPTGGTSPYTYLWSNGQTTQTIIGLSAGTYTVTVIDANGCIKQDEVIITQAQVITCTTTTTDVSCNGGVNGTASVIANGGTQPLTYSWNTLPAQSTATATGLSAGTYTVNIADANGCTSECTATVNQASSNLFCSISVTNVSCFNGANGSLEVTVIGGTGLFSYSWNTIPVQTNSTATGLTAGLYSVLVTDANGCSTSCFELVSQPTSLTCTINVTQTSCGVSNGQLAVSPNGGTPSYSFLWSNGSTDQAIVNLGAGTYTATVTDFNGCTSTCEGTINGSTAIIFTTSNTQANCNGVCNGTATVVSVLGGTAPYNYSWSNGNTNNTALGLCAATYTIVVSDINGCSNSASITITEPTAIALAFSNVINVSCNGGNNGQAKVNPTGGTPSYNYLWSNGTTNQTAVGLIAGTYMVVVTDQNGCTVSDNVIINQSGSLTFQQNQTNVLCFGELTGEGTLNPSGGTAPYSYLWSNAQTTQTSTGLGAGNYTVVISDINGCSIVANFDITEPALLICEISQSNPLCNQSCDGFATAVISGGTASYSFVWSDGQTNQTATGLCAGIYTVTTQDFNGCITTCSVTLLSPALLSCTVSSNDITCNGLSNGSATATAIGGTSPFGYLWSDGQTTQTASGLISGSYSAVITDQNGCTTSCSVIVTEPAVIVINVINVVNATCGLNNSSAEVMAAGGTITYTYIWSNGQSGPILLNVAGGIYTVTVTDINQCTASQSVSISGTSELTAIISGSNPSCNPGNSGSATITVTGGDANYLYQWNTSPIQTTQTATGLNAGQYVALVTDGGGCTVVDSIILVQPGNLVCNAIASPGGCGLANGTASVSATGGILPYSYLWNNGSTLASLTNLAPGTYTATVTDGNNCTSSCSSIVTGGPKINNIDIDVTKVTCFGAADGTICVVLINGGTPPFSYLWNNGATTSCLTNQTNGTFTVTVTDVNGCSIQSSGQILQPSLLVCSTAVLSNANCNACDGSAKVFVTGGTAIYSRVWNTIPVQTTGTATGLCAGIYTVTITDKKGCTTSCSVTVSSINTLACSIAPVNPSCNGAINGTATVTVTGAGIYPLTYLWSNGQTTQTATGLSTGNYTVTATSTAGCATSCVATIVQPAPLNCSINTIKSATCGKCNGTIRAIPTGGTGPFTYSWNTLPIRTTATINKLCVGNYVVTITDSKGCTTQCNILLIAVGGPVCDISGNTAICQGGSTQLCGPSGLSTYLWSTGATTQCITASVAGTYSITVSNVVGCTSNCNVIVTEEAIPICDITGNTEICDGSTTLLCAPTSMSSYLWSNGATTQCVELGIAGTYTVTVTNSLGCTSSCNTTISVNPTPICSISGNTGLCLGSFTELCAASGADNYLWTTGETTQCITIGQPGDYTVTVSSSLGCTSSCSTTVNIGQTPVCDIIGNPNICSGETTLLCAPAGLNGYLWSSGETTACISASAGGLYSVIVTGEFGCTSACDFTLTENVSPICSIIQNGTFCAPIATPQLCATIGMSAYLWSSGETTRCIEVPVSGTYTVTITNSDGCTASCSQFVSPGTPISNVLIDKTDVNCSGANDGTACANTIIGGTSPFTYLWSSGGTNACIVALSPGTYTVTVTDFNGCTQTKKTTITQPASIIDCNISDFGDASCAACNGFATVSANGGTPSYFYSWNTSPIQTTATATGLCAGNYLVTVTDLNGCSSNCSINISGTNTISCSITSTDAICFGGLNGSAIVSVLGNNGPFSYLWNDGQTTQTAIGLSAGLYSVTVSSGQGCSTQCFTQINEPSEINIAFGSIIDVSCNGGNNGSVSISAIGGNGTYSYLWSNGSTNVLNNGLVAGTYIVTVTDLNGCTSSDFVTIEEPETLICNVTSNNSSCGLSNGSVTVNVNGGTSGYTYLWSNGATTATVSALLAGSYTATVTDANGCTTTCNGAISVSGNISLTITKTKISCFGGSNGTATANPTGGLAPYTYLWSNGQTTKTAIGLLAQQYIVTATSSQGCSASGLVNILQATQVVVAIQSQSNVSCFNGNNGALTGSATGGNAGALSYSWSNGQSTQTINNLTAGNYTVTVTDSKGCTGTVSAAVTAPLQLVINATATNASCNGTNSGAAQVSPTGGTGTLSVFWSNGQTTNSIIGLIAGVYTATVTDINGCTASQSVTVNEPAAIATPTASITTNATCFSACNGSVVLNTISGGTAPYAYLWSNGVTSSSINQLCAGTYTVIVTDENLCTVTASFVISQPNQLSVLTSQTNVSSCNNTDGTASVNPSGGTPAYFYAWSNGSSLASISSLAAGTYAVTVTDLNGCSVTSSVTLTQPAYVCSTFVSGHKQTYYSPQGCAGCDTINEYAIANFSSAFPSGLTIGCSTGFNIQFTNINTVLAFLPSANSSAALTQNYIDPTASPLNNGLASQIATLAMTIRFDLTDANFAPTSTVNFKDLIVDSVGPWNGKTVQEIFEEAQRQLGGCPATFPISKSQLSVITSRINSSWDLGNQTSTFLKCPPNSCDFGPNKSMTASYSDDFNVASYPNPTDDKLNLQFSAATKTNYNVKMMDMKGVLIFNQEHESNIGINLITYNLNALPKGLYMIQVTTGDKAKTIKVVLQ